jgi:F-type H+-transporting ATPase subunit b
LLLCPECFAEETTSKGRIIWDNVMLFINFGILVFLFIKFGKKPLMGFLDSESKRISKGIDEIEEQVQKARSIMDSEAAKLEGMDERTKEIRDQFLEIGKREKRKIIEKAEIAARKMMDDAGKEAEYRLEKAKRGFSEEMLDIAITLAVEELNKGFTQEDNEMIIDQFSEGLAGEKGHFA